MADGRPSSPATILATCVLALPWACGALGISLAILAWPHYFAVAMALLIAAFGWTLRPRRMKPPEGIALTRADLPEFFADLDIATQAMGAPQVDQLVVDDQLNAFITQTDGKVTLGIGAILWDALPPEERRAVVAHELGHLIAGDPRRSGLTAKAFQVLDEWQNVLDTGLAEGGTVASDILLFPLRLLTEMIEHHMSRLTSADSIAAEFRADAIAAELVGAKAVRAALETLQLSPIVEAAYRGMAYGMAPKGREMVQTLAAALDAASEAEKSAVLGARDPTLDLPYPSHPSLQDRIHALAGMRGADPVGRELPEEPALAAAIAAQGDRLHAALEVQ